MSETKAPTAETMQEAGTQAAANKNENTGENTANNTAANEPIETAEGATTRQRFFSQMEVNRIVKREIDRALKTSKLPELEAAQAKVSELESRVKRDELRAAVTEAAVKAGAKNANLLFRAIEEKIEPGDDGKPKNLDEIIKDARRDYPELFRREINGNANGGAGQANNPRLSMNELLRRGRE